MKPGVRADIERNGLPALVMVREPLSWLQSMKKAPYDLRACLARVDWLTAPAGAKHIHSPAKNHGQANGRAAAIRKLQTKYYVQKYSTMAKQSACDRLDKGLLQHFEYTDCA